MPLTPEAIAKAARCPLSHVEESWPLVLSALEEQGIRTDLVEVAAAATIAVETGTFLPVRERRISDVRKPTDTDESYAARMRIRDMQNRYWSSCYYGRGFIQLTWKKNYQAYGEALGLDLLLKPDLMLEAEPAARVLALYFDRMGVHVAADAHDWRAVRRLVNGGYNGWETFNAIVCELLEVLGA